MVVHQELDAGTVAFKRLCCTTMDCGNEVGQTARLGRPCEIVQDLGQWQVRGPRANAAYCFSNMQTFVLRLLICFATESYIISCLCLKTLSE